MKKLICGALTAALGALVFAALCFREGSRHYSSGYARFAECPASPIDDLSIARDKEMVEIQREIHPASEIKFHPPERPNKPIEALGIHCYIGSVQNSKTNSCHDQTQLIPLLI